VNSLAFDFLGLLFEMMCDSPDLLIHFAGADNEEIRHCIEFAQVENDDILRFFFESRFGKQSCQSA
jgi:hypothetical protein